MFTLVVWLVVSQFALISCRAIWAVGMEGGEQGAENMWHEFVRHDSLKGGIFLAIKWEEHC